MKVFRPCIKFSGMSGYGGANNWHDNTRRYPTICNTINRRVMYDIFGYLHYLAWHAPEKVQNKWRSAERRFRKKHDPSSGSIRWTQKYTASNRF